jgi:arabinogalactan endo-1,4-beta-galactosidase
MFDSMKIDLYEYNQLVTRMDKAEEKAAKLTRRLKEAVNLLSSCLEWNNGGERDYNNICAFINETMIGEKCL